MSDPANVIMGAAAFVVLGGATALKIVLGLYMDERKQQQANFVNTVNAQIASIKSAYESAAGRIERFDQDVKAVKATLDKEIPALRIELKEVKMVSGALMTFFSNGGDRESEVVPIGENAWLVRKKNGKPPGAG